MDVEEAKVAPAAFVFLAYLLFLLSLLEVPNCTLTFGFPELPPTIMTMWPELMIACANCTVAVARLETLIGALYENEPPNEPLV